jgi:hypothetical protein
MRPLSSPCAFLRSSIWSRVANPSAPTALLWTSATRPSAGDPAASAGPAHCGRDPLLQVRVHRGTQPLRAHGVEGFAPTGEKCIDPRPKVLPQAHQLSCRPATIPVRSTTFVRLVHMGGPFREARYAIERRIGRVSKGQRTFGPTHSGCGIAPHRAADPRRRRSAVPMEDEVHLVRGESLSGDFRAVCGGWRRARNWTTLLRLVTCAACLRSMGDEARRSSEPVPPGPAAGLSPSCAAPAAAQLGLRRA